MKKLMLLNPNLGIQCYKANDEEVKRCTELAKYVVVELNDSYVDKIIGGICEKHIVILVEDQL